MGTLRALKTCLTFRASCIHVALLWFLRIACITETKQANLVILQTDWWTWRRVITEKPTPSTLGRLQTSCKSQACLKTIDFHRLALYRVHIYTALLALVTVCTDDETVFDAYNSVCAEMIDLVDFLLAHESTCLRSSGPKFSFDSFVVVPLHSKLLQGVILLFLEHL